MINIFCSNDGICRIIENLKILLKEIIHIAFHVKIDKQSHGISVSQMTTGLFLKNYLQNTTQNRATWKPGLNSIAPEGQAIHAQHVAPVV
jgi:hypothetical protein